MYVYARCNVIRGMRTFTTQIVVALAKAIITDRACLKGEAGQAANQRTRKISKGITTCRHERACCRYSALYFEHFLCCGRAGAWKETPQFGYAHNALAHVAAAEDWPGRGAF